MTLADWVFDAGFSAILSENDAPTGGSNPTIKMRRDSTTSELSATPSGGTINGKSILDIKQGILEGFAKMDLTTASQARGCVFFRFVDINNHYRVEFNTNGSSMTHAIKRRSAGVDTVIRSNTSFSGVAGVTDGTWFRFKITWWSSSGKCWIRVELATVTGNFVQQGSDISDTVDAHTGAGIKIGIGLSSNCACQFDASFDDLKVYKSG